MHPFSNSLASCRRWWETYDVLVVVFLLLEAGGVDVEGRLAREAAGRPAVDAAPAACRLRGE